METNQIVELSYSLHINKGVYALLLGSGVSRSAGIPTGWEITVDLTKKLSLITDGEESASPEAWFEKKYSLPLTYSNVIDRLGNSPEERMGILNSYIEPKADEVAPENKTPTSAHRAIARLVKSGTVKVILTTNFDRLLEKALEEQGISPTVISSPEATEGAIPLIHSPCTIIKIHGDYKDTRIKNTLDELSNYDSRIESLLTRIFDEFGLLICGWSAEWDVALRSLIESTKSRRFQIYWATLKQLSGTADTLAKLRSAKQIIVKDADEFFETIESKLNALALYDSPHPLSADLAVIELKKYVVEEKFKIKLYDLFNNEAKRVVKKLQLNYPTNGSVDVSGNGLENRLNSYFEELKVLLPIFVEGVTWGEQKHHYLWFKILSDIANAQKDEGGYQVLNDLKFYPACLLLYSAGVALVANNNYQLLESILLEVKIKYSNDEKRALDELPVYTLTRNEWMQQLPGKERQYTALNNKIFEQIGSYFVPNKMSSDEFEHVFDKFEFLFAMIYSHYNSSDDRDFIWSPPSRFSWKEEWKTSITSKTEDDIIKQGNKWLPVDQGLFNSDKERALLICKEVRKFKQKLGFRW
ncbi:MAG: SIR2 family protein [Bacteriovoracaceae bacterium]|nr:SIR2 family protein [Bacteriovoracaceae bacterium]